MSELTSEQIKSIASSGEGYNAEFKVSVPSKAKELAQEVCAFANSEGGYLLIGVDDDGIIKGTEINNAKRPVIQFDDIYKLTKNKKNTLEIMDGTRGLEVTDKSNPTQYPQ